MSGFDAVRLGMHDEVVDALQENTHKQKEHRTTFLKGTTTNIQILRETPNNYEI